MMDDETETAGHALADPEMTAPLRRALDALYLWSGYLAGVFLIAIFVIMLGLSAGRPLGIDVPAGDDFASWCMAATAFLGLAHTFRSGEIIRVGLLVERVQGGARLAIEIFCLLLGTSAALYFAWYAIEMTRFSFQFNDLSQGVIAVPLWIPQLGFTSGLIILAIAMVDELFHVIRGGTPRYEQPPAANAEEVIERAIQSGA